MNGQRKTCVCIGQRVCSISDVFYFSGELARYFWYLWNMLKDQLCVVFADMTSVLPTAKYSSSFGLNLFVEYDVVTSENFSEFFGFSDLEVDKLYSTYQNKVGTPKFDREKLRLWSDGYYTTARNCLYNSHSVVLALTDYQLANYWASSGPYDELFYYIRNSIKDVRENLICAGEVCCLGVDSFLTKSAF